MSYQHDPDGPIIDKDAFKARVLEVCGILFISGIIIFIVMKVMRPESKRIDDAISLAKLELKYSPYNYSFNNSDDVLTVNLWSSGLTATAKKASEGDLEAVKEWNATKDNVLQYAYAIDSNLFVEDIENITVLVQIVNENNHERKLLVFKNSTLVYDVTEGG